MIWRGWLSLNYLSIAIFVTVYLLIALRNLRWFKIPIWTIMLTGAVAKILSGVIPLQTAYSAINLDVIFFLLGMFSIVAAMELSGSSNTLQQEWSGSPRRHSEPWLWYCSGWVYSQPF